MKFLILYIILSLLPVSVCAAEVDVSAKSAICFEYTTGKTVYAKNEKERLPMASTTKIMTALIALECGNLDDMVTISKRAACTEGSSMYLKAGEKVPLETLLYGLMLSSGNDAAVAIAEHIGESIENFSAMMTQKARELGCVDTQFKNPNGLPDDNHYTTAFDLARITGKALENQKFREIVASKYANVGGKNLTNHNKLLSLYEGAIGVKTGFTRASGRTLVSAAQRDGVELICVTLNAPDDWDDHIKMLDFGFSEMERRVICTKGEIARLRVPVESGEREHVNIVFGGDISLSVLKQDKTSVNLMIPESISAPVSVDEPVGIAEIYLENVKMGEIALLAQENIGKTTPPGFLRVFLSVLEKWSQFFI